MNRNSYTPYLQEASKIVIKVGSSRLASGEHSTNDFLFSLVSDIRSLRDSGKQVVLVSSGAIAQGKNTMARMPTQASSNRTDYTLEEKQAFAAIGQSKLMKLYEGFFSKVNLTIAQILFGYPQIKDSSSFRNLKNTFAQLAAWGVLPIVNENDSIATEELKLGDNDILSSLVALFLQADLLIILTGVDGFIEDGACIPYLEDITPENMSYARGPEGPGTGGMRTKLQAGGILSRNGIPTAIINGKEKNCVRNLLTQNQSGTLIASKQKNVQHTDTEIIEILRKEYNVKQMEVGI